MVTINLDELTRHGEVRNLSGHERGVAARVKYGLATADLGKEQVLVVVPDEIYTITPSFFQGMFAESVHKAGTRELFLSKFRFSAPPVILRQIESGIESSLMKRQSIFS